MTPERTLLDVELAGIFVRAGAFLIDIIFITIGIAIISTFSTVITFLLGPFGFLMNFILIIFVSFAFLMYFSICDVKSQGQTLGKKVLKIRTIMQDGSPVTWRASIIRSVLIFADMMPGIFGVAILTLLFSTDSQRFGDMAAGTLVIIEPETLTKFSPAPYKFGLHPLEETVHNLRRVTPQEYNIIKTLCDRFVYLNPETQYRMIKEIWEPFCVKHEIHEVSGWHSMYLMEAVVMKYGRERELL